MDGERYYCKSCGVLVEANAFVAGEPALDAVVELGELLAFAVRDEGEFEVADTVGVVQQAFVFEWIDFVEDDDVWWAVVLSEALKELVYRG